jgi:hypothetical protein
MMTVAMESALFVPDDYVADEVLEFLDRTTEEKRQ